MPSQSRIVSACLLVRTGPLRTGYAEPVFKEIGERYGPIDLSAIPTGAYEPRWFMSAQHVNPAEAVQLHLDVRSKCSMAIHCCTFSLTDEPLDEPPALLVRELRDRGLDAASFLTVQHGQTMVVRDGRVVNEPKTLPLVLPPAQQQP